MRLTCACVGRDTVTMKIAFVACCKTKGDHAQPAGALYKSSLFRKSLLAALDSNDAVYILSAKHGVVALNDIIEPYELTLKTMAKSQRHAWGNFVGAQLTKLVGGSDLVSLYCGEDYVTPLTRTLGEIGCSVRLPLGSLSIGPRQTRLRLINDEATLDADVERLQQLTRRLAVGQGRGRPFADVSSQEMPSRGVYIILAPELSGRIVRVGTHAVSRGSRTSLWNRLSTHRGTRDGRGSHRSSIFRSHVGRALIAASPARDWPDSWAVGQQAAAAIRAQEVSLERHVSDHINELRLLWLTVQDDAGPASDRAYLERNLIGLISREGLLHCRGTANWLGLRSHDWRIAATGLWNLNHILTKPDPDFLDVLESYVEITLGRVSAPKGPIAPAGRHKRKISRTAPQLELFEGWEK